MAAYGKTNSENGPLETTRPMGMRTKTWERNGEKLIISGHGATHNRSNVDPNGRSEAVQAGRQSGMTSRPPDHRPVTVQHHPRSPQSIKPRQLMADAQAELPPHGATPFLIPQVKRI